MFPEWLTARARQMAAQVVEKTLARTTVTATALTVTAPILTLGVVWLLAEGSLVAAGIVTLLVSAFDMLDGAVARVKKQVSPFGAFLDSTLDRYSEILIFLGLLLYCIRFDLPALDSVLVLLSATGSLMVSYARARAEALGFDCKVGLLERPERVLVLAAGMVFHQISFALWALSILTHFTAGQRIVHVWMQSRRTTVPGKLADKPAGSSLPAMNGE